MTERREARGSSDGQRGQRRRPPAIAQAMAESSMESAAAYPTTSAPSARAARALEGEAAWSLENNGSTRG